MKVEYLDCEKPRICQQCQKPFSNRAMIDGRKVKLDSRSYCLECSPFNGNKGSRRGNRKQLSKYKEVDGKQCKLCRGCQSWVSTDDFYVHKGYLSSLCKACNRLKSKADRLSLKTEAIDYKGGKCVDCQHSFHMSVYDFHHLDPTKKDFHLMSNLAAKLSTIKAELDKCVLLCSNCHRLRHFDSDNPNYCPTGRFPV